MNIYVSYRFLLLTALSVASLFAQADPLAADLTPAAAAELKPDPDDQGVIRARKDLERIRTLINQGALPAMRLRKAQEDLQNAEDLSILQANLFGKDLT